MGKAAKRKEVKRAIRAGIEAPQPEAVQHPWPKRQSQSGVGYRKRARVDCPQCRGVGTMIVTYKILAGQPLRVCKCVCCRLETRGSIPALAAQDVKAA